MSEATPGTAPKRVETLDPHHPCVHCGHARAELLHPACLTPVLLCTDPVTLEDAPGERWAVEVARADSCRGARFVERRKVPR